MQYRSLVMALAVLFAVSSVAPVQAHHSRSNFDLKRFVTLEGTVSQVHWLFPHVFVYLDVEDEQGQAQIWVMEGGSPPSIIEAGVGEGDVRPGDRVIMRCHPLLDGATGCVSGYVTPMHGDTARGHGVERPWN